MWGDVGRCWEVWGDLRLETRLRERLGGLVRLGLERLRLLLRLERRFLMGERRLLQLQPLRAQRRQGLLALEQLGVGLAPGVAQLSGRRVLGRAQLRLELGHLRDVGRCGEMWGDVGR